MTVNENLQTTPGSILVLGGTGKTGRRIVDRLRAREIPVRVGSLRLAADLLPIESASEPDPRAAEVYADLLPVFADLYDALGPAFRALKRLQR